MVTWGSANYGGDSSAVQDQLRDVLQIQVLQETFSAILCDGSVVSWGGPEGRADTWVSAVLKKLLGITSKPLTPKAGLVVPW